MFKVSSSMSIRPPGDEGSSRLRHGSGEFTSARTPLNKKRASMPFELMAGVFAMLDKKACVAACLVCRRWSSAALDELWRSLPSLVPLFGVLGPPVETEKGQDLRPDCVLTAQSWELFKSYATRIRCLTYDDHKGDTVILTGLIIQALAVHPGGILPNLRALHCQVSGPGLTQILAFCPPSLERLSLHIGEENVEVDSVKRLLSGLPYYLANRLKFFGFGTAFSITDNDALGASLNAFLSNQGGLLEVKFPYYEIRHPATISAVCQASPQLHIFCGEIHGIPKEILQEVLSALAGRSASLRCIRLISEPHEEEVYLTDIEPMLQLSVFEDIRLWLDCRLELRSTDIQQMGQAWKGLTSLILRCSEPGIPLPHLATFAQWFPALQKFAACFNCSEYIPSADEVPSRFRSLRILTLLDVSITDYQMPRIAEFLAIVCGPKAEVRTDRSCPDSGEFMDELLPWQAGRED